MRRIIYIWLLRLHPAPFKDQFASEMLAIFDDPSSRECSRGLFTDAVVSLLRQWVVRPEFRNTAVFSEVQMFASLDDYRLRPEVVLFGSILSVALLCSLVFGIGRPGTASRWLIGAHRRSEGLLQVTRSSMEGPEPDTRVALTQHEDPWRAWASVYFTSIPLLKALDADHDLTISAQEIATASAALQQLDKDHDGKLNPEECGFVLGSSNLGMNFTARMRADFMRFHPVVAALDSDHNGEISTEELRNSSQSLRRLDINGDGSLSPPEVTPNQAASWAGIIVATFDTNHDGQISAAESAQAGSFGELLMSADRNHDGFVTLHELTEEFLLREGARPGK